jgi:hypothetical protein
MPLPDMALTEKAVALFDAERKASTKPRRPGQPQFAKATRAVARRLDRLAAELARGELTLQAYTAAALEALEDGHAVAASLGRRRAGDPASLGSEDSLRASIVMREERGHFERFSQQLAKAGTTDRRSLPGLATTSGS